MSIAGDPNEPDRSFSHARAKIRWANQHIVQLNAWCNEFIKEQSEALAVLDPEAGLRIGPAPIPVAVALAAGDIIFNLCSALDCCWMGLKRAIDASADKGTLPRADTRKEVEGTLKKASVEVAFNGSDDFILDTVKPYEAGNKAIWFLAKADNWNKHNLLILTLTHTVATGLVVTYPGGVKHVINNMHVSGNGPINIGQGPGDGHFESKGDVTFNIVFHIGPPGQEKLLMPFLIAAINETHQVVEAFISTFGTVALR